MPMPPPVGEAESNPIMIAVMDAKPITAIVVLVRMGMAATPAATISTPAATISTSTAIIFLSTPQTLLDTFHCCAAKGCRLHPHIHHQSLENHNYYMVKYF